MKNGLMYIVGKRIAAVVVASSKERSPEQQVFLVFPDGSRFEIYGKQFTCCSGLDKAEDIERYVASGKGKIDAVYHEPIGAEDDDTAPLPVWTKRPRPKVSIPDSLADRMKLDLEAWRLAKGAIAAAAKPK